MASEFGRAHHLLLLRRFGEVAEEGGGHSDKLLELGLREPVLKADLALSNAFKAVEFGDRAPLVVLDEEAEGRVVLEANSDKELEPGRNNTRVYSHSVALYDRGAVGRGHRGRGIILYGVCA